MARLRIAWLAAGLWLAGCAPAASATSASPTAHPSPSPSLLASGSGATADPRQDAVLGPAGMTLRQEIGAVMMVGFQGPLSPAVLDDWRQRQFGGLIVMPIDHNGADPASIRQLIGAVRGVMAHPLLAATTVEGGSVCLLEAHGPCGPGAPEMGARGAAAVQSGLSSMSQPLKALGFDINLAPVADVWDGVHPFIRDRSYGRNPQTVAGDVSAAIAGIHAAGMYAAARDFPGQGAADEDSQSRLPVVSESVATLRSRDWVPFQAAVAAHVEFVMVGHLRVPALDNSAPSSMSAAVLSALRSDLGFNGVAISDDLQMAALGPDYPPPVAAVRFLTNGGDMVMVSHDITAADATYDAIHNAVLTGAYSRAQLDASVQKLLNLSLRYMP
jgi:beta-N-acetylhexosaminidase